MRTACGESAFVARTESKDAAGPTLRRMTMQQQLLVNTLVRAVLDWIRRRRPPTKREPDGRRVDDRAPWEVPPIVFRERWGPD